MELDYTFWEAKEGGYIGYLDEYPDYWTEGDTISELQNMLISLYSDIKKLS
ncbi:MAG: type II toxin-antitoxin system HicB family antitoxin [Spirochaetaceae bacterium]|jgi:predicted RNase H-like HicB family nuclease|nr:type II toxin-antitoxin system HicB family antitoxin [Spirochaetaceae bacterium]